MLCLCSSSKNLPSVPTFNLNCYDARTFSFCAPRPRIYPLYQHLILTATASGRSLFVFLLQEPTAPGCCLSCSSSKNLPSVPTFNLNCYGARTFSFCAPPPRIYPLYQHLILTATAPGRSLSVLLLQEPTLCTNI